MAVPNVLVDIQRGAAVNSFGDDVDVATTVHASVPFSILEQHRTTSRRVDARAQTLLYYTGRCNGNVDVLMGDRLKDAAGTYYLVTAISTVGNPISPSDVRVDLERVKTN